MTGKMEQKVSTILDRILMKNIIGEMAVSSGVHRDGMDVRERPG
jgi:hypothetical protein